MKKSPSAGSVSSINLAEEAEAPNPRGLSRSNMSMADMTDGFVKSTESTFGKPHASRETVRNARRVVVKVGTAVVTRHTDNRLALGRLGALVEQLHALVRSGRQVILVTSGAVCVGRQVLRQQHILNSSPLQMMGNHNFCVASKLQAAATIDAELKPEAAPSNIDALPGARAVAPRAAAAAGQTGLMALYDSLFTMMDMQAAQLLVTASDFEHDGFREALTATAEDLLSMNVIPVFNENDAILSAMPLLKEEGGQKRGRFRDNDGLAALLAVQLNADLLMLCTDVDGLFTGNPSDPDSEFIPTYSPEVHKEMISFASKSTNGRGGMMAKVEAAWMAAEQGCSVVILNGKKPDSILQVIAGQLAGTLFNSESARMVELELQAQANGHGGGGAEADARRAAASKNSARDCALRARDASRTLQSLPSEKRVAILQRVAESLLAAQDEILAANEEDVAASSGKIDNTLMQRLKLKPAKLQALAAGIRAIAGQDEPIGRQISKMEIAEGLILEKVSSPIGVVLIIFEARPDALPQIASLAIRSGNGLLLKGGKEAARSNEILHRLIVEAIEDVAPEVGRDLISLVTSREGVSELLSNDDVIDLVIPRGSNSLVSHIQQNTKIPVLGHADGICHIYVDEEADLGMATKIVLDSKSDYPAACNAVEKVLVHSALAEDGRLFKLQAALRDADITMYGGEKSVRALGLTAAPSPRHEYGNLSLTLELVDSMDEAIDHIHKNGSSHTESIVTDNTATAEDFLRRVDAACVDHNTSTRFSDGFRYGLGAEVGISTARIHARGPVGVEGLMTTRFLLRGNGHLVNKDKDIVYTHRPLPINQGANGELTNGGNGH